jgi:hypothetical protein
MWKTPVLLREAAGEQEVLKMQKAAKMKIEISKKIKTDSEKSPTFAPVFFKRSGERKS